MGSIVEQHATTGQLGLWDGTKDGKEGYVDYKNGQTNVETNVNLPRDVEIKVQDMRHLQPLPTLMVNGYQLISYSTALSAREFEQANTVEGKPRIYDVYFEEIGRLLRDMTGSDLVFLSSFKTRKELPNPKEYLQNAIHRFGPRPVAHVDRDLPTAIVALRDAVGKEKADALLKEHKRWAQVNVWRPIRNSVQKWPLVFANHDEIPDWDYDTHMGRVYSFNDPRVADRGEKSYDCVLKDDPRYKYHYASNISPEEVLVFCSFDSDPKMAVPHGAFWDDNTPEDALPRQSIEVRSFVFFKE